LFAPFPTPPGSDVADFFVILVTSFLNHAGLKGTGIFCPKWEPGTGTALQIAIHVSVDLFPLQGTHEAVASGVVVRIGGPAHAGQHALAGDTFAPSSGPSRLGRRDLLVFLCLCRGASKRECVNHLVSNLIEAVAHDVQKLQVDTRRQLAESEAAESMNGRPTWDERTLEKLRKP
jgi:hypothetical protein